MTHNNNSNIAPPPERTWKTTSSACGFVYPQQSSVSSDSSSISYSWTPSPNVILSQHPRNPATPSSFFYCYRTPPSPVYRTRSLSGASFSGSSGSCFFPLRHPRSFHSFAPIQEPQPSPPLQQRQHPQHHEQQQRQLNN